MNCDEILTELSGRMEKAKSLDPWVIEEVTVKFEELNQLKLGLNGRVALNREELRRKIKPFLFPREIDFVLDAVFGKSEQKV